MPWLALAARERPPLAESPKFYGAGVDAIDYKGDFAAYRHSSKAPVTTEFFNRAREKHRYFYIVYFWLFRYKTAFMALLGLRFVIRR